MGKDTRTSGTSIVLAVILFAALSVVVSLLFLLKDRLRAATERLPEQIAVRLRPEMLRLPDEIPRFDQIEKFARQAHSEFSNLEELFVTKVRVDNVERCIYPWDYPGLPDPSLQNLKIEQGGLVLGYLYLKLDTRREKFIERLIDVLIPLLILAAFLLAVHVWRQERVLASTRFELVEKNKELAHLERMSLAGQLAANLLHDLKKPVLHIRDELRHNPTPDPNPLLEQADLFFQLLRETNLEKLAATSDDREEYLDIEEIIQVSRNLVKYEQNQVEVTLEIEPGLPFVKGYKYRLVQVLSNLLLNAFQALKGKGKVWIRARQQEQQEKHWVVVEIADNGDGIAPEHLPHVFEPFYTASGRPDASGLGLYISRSIVEEISGRIEMESIRGQGTRVRVFLPAEVN